MTPPLARRNLAHGNNVRQSEMVVESSESSLFLKRNLCLRAPEPLLFAEPRQRGQEQILEQGCRAVFVGIGQGGAARRLGDAQMHQPPQAAAQAVADLAQRIGAAELAEQHGDELRPAAKALGGTLGGVLLDQCGELGPGKMLEQLIEQARDLYDCVALLVGGVWRGSRPRNDSPTSIIGGHSFYFRLQEPVLDKSNPGYEFPLLVFLAAFALLVITTRMGDALRRRAELPKENTQPKAAGGERRNGVATGPRGITPAFSGTEPANSSRQSHR